MMTNISKYHSVKVISAVMGFIVLSELAVAQDMGKNDSVSVRTEKTDMPYKSERTDNRCCDEKKDLPVPV